MSKTLCQFIEEQGLLCEVHRVTTDDGYILQVYRMKSPKIQAGAKVAFL